MAETKYDVFISYRRKGGAEKAELLKAVFEKRGYPEERIFMDTHALKGGDFTLKLKDAITASTNVIVLITKGCFDQIKEDDFWVYEISQALEQHKNIIPVYFDGIKQIDGKELREVLKHLPYQNAVSYVHEYADASYDKICSFMIKNDVEEEHKSPQQKTNKTSTYKRGCTLTLTIALLVILGIFILNPFDNKSYSISSHDSNDKYIAQAPSSPKPNFTEPDVLETPRSLPEPEPKGSPLPTPAASPIPKQVTTTPSPTSANRQLTIGEAQIIIQSGKATHKIPDSTTITVNGKKMDYLAFRILVNRHAYSNIKVKAVNPDGSITVGATENYLE